MQVIWTEPAKCRLKEIYLYYKHYASLKIAHQLRKKILNATQSLYQFSKRGTIEQLAKEIKKEYRYLVEGNYKIIYRIDEKDEKLYIIDIFDCRQNPDKLQKIN